MSSVKPSHAEAAEQSGGFAAKSLIIIVTFSLVALAAVGAAVYFYVQYQKTQEQLKSPTSAAEAETASLITEVGKLIVLPTGEQPTVATVSDINKLKGQSFFANAKNGDKVLIYTKAEKAFLYDPSQKKIINVGPINLAQSSPTPVASSSAGVSPTAKLVKVVLYNGTSVVGLTTKVEQELKTSAPNITVVDRDNASKNTYIKTIVVDLTGKQTAAAAALAKTLNGQVGSLPAGETKPASADLLVILGK